MHELSLCQAIVQTVDARAGERPVRRVDVRIGHLRQVVPDALLFSWEMLTDATNLEGCELAIEHVPAVVHCRSCGDRTKLTCPILACSACEGLDVDLVSGNEFQLASIDVAAEAV